MSNPGAFAHCLWHAMVKMWAKFWVLSLLQISCHSCTYWPASQRWRLLCRLMNNLRLALGSPTSLARALRSHFVCRLCVPPISPPLPCRPPGSGSIVVIGSSLPIEPTSQSPKDGPMEAAAMALAICPGVRAMRPLLGDPGLPLGKRGDTEPGRPQAARGVQVPEWFVFAWPWLFFGLSQYRLWGVVLTGKPTTLSTQIMSEQSALLRL